MFKKAYNTRSTQGLQGLHKVYTGSTQGLHRLLMLNTVYTKDMIIESSITQLTYISILANTQLMRSIAIR